MKTKFQFLFVALLLFANAHSAILTVPGSFNSIQEAITNASGGDTIVVNPGTYYENINFMGKNVFLTSLFYLNGDVGYITSTIINGSNPANPDTGSCVIFNNYEDSTTVLQGFTITGGTGTVWLDIHGAGIYREGGGILIEFSSPTIRYNLIKENAVTDLSGVISTGGGGIRVGDGNPEICNNVIINNEARYGAGIVLNYTGAKIRNNIIASNTGGQDYYGGSGIWINNNLPATPKIIENNTIVNNYAVAANGTGGVSAWSAANVNMKNNIIYGNLPALQIRTISSVPQVNYSNIQGGYAGTGNIDADPLFTPDRYFLQSGSPCIDGGDDAVEYNDNENVGSPGSALFPSMASLRNDMGAFGGPGAFLVPPMVTALGLDEVNLDQQLSIYPNPASSVATIYAETDFNGAVLHLYDNNGRMIEQLNNISGNKMDINVDQLPAGLYHILIRKKNGQFISCRIVIKPRP